MYTAKSETVLVDQTFWKSDVFHFIKLVGWKTSNQILSHKEKNEENKTTNESQWNIFAARFSLVCLHLSYL